MLSRKQKEYLIKAHDNGFLFHKMFPYSAMNRPVWKLVEMELLIFDWGPRGSWLKEQLFLPIWTDPVC